MRSVGRSLARTALVLAMAATALPGRERSDPDFPGRPLRLGLDLAVSAEGTRPFEDLCGVLSARLERPVEPVTHTDRERLVNGFVEGRLDMVLVGCRALGELERLSPGPLRPVARLELNGRTGYRAVLAAPPGRLPEPLRLAVGSQESTSGLVLQKGRRRVRTVVAGGPLAALELVLTDRADAAAVPEEALREAARQGLPVDGLEVQPRSAILPFEVLLVGGEIDTDAERRLKTSVLAHRYRSPGGVSIQWRAVDVRSHLEGCDP